MNQIEIIAVVFSLLSVILAVKNNFLTWPVGIVGVIFYGILFYQTKTWGNMYLQFIFVAQSLYGWYNWNKDKTILPIEKLDKHDINLFVITTGLLCFFISFVLLMTGDKQPYLDGITTGLSIVGTLLLAFKKIDNWYYWIAADVLYIYLFYSQGLYWSTGIYFVFLLLAISGLKTWNMSLSEEVKTKMSESAILAFKEGRRSPGSGWARIHTKEYKGLDYQSKYELKFIQYLESKGKLDIIEKGPTIPYFDMNGKEHMYFSDFKIKNTNIIFEIKSWYYWEKNKEINIIKKETASKIYDFYLIMDNNFSDIDKLIENEKI